MTGVLAARLGRENENEKELEMKDPSAPGDGIQWADHRGELLVVDAHEVLHGIQTAYGETDAIRADVFAIEADAEYLDCYVFPRVLQSQLRRSIGERVLARLGQGDAKKGQDPPWMLVAVNDPKDRERAQQWERQQGPKDPAPAGNGQDVPF